VTVFKALYVIGKWLHVYHLSFIIISVLIEGRFSVVYVLLLCVKYYIPDRKSILKILFWRSFH